MPRVTPARPKPPFRVQILHDGDSLEYFRNVTLGARHYAFSTGRFVLADRWLDHEAGHFEELIERDGIQGMVVAAHREDAERRFEKLPVPVVNVSNVVRHPRLPLATQDDVEAGRLAARHLLARGCSALAFWGEYGSRFSEQRLQGFREELASQGQDGNLHVNGHHAMEPAPEIFVRMKTWLATLPKALGVFCVLDTAALYLVRAAYALGRRVPEDVAILGTGDDEFWVRFESVPLSSVKLPSHQIGYEAAALLDELIRTGRRKGARILSVGEIAARQSTDTLFVEDAAVARAVRCIRRNAGRELYVDEIVREAGVARTALQRSFKAVLGHSLMDELAQARIALARTLLASTDLPMEGVAERSGLPSSHRLSVFFRAHMGMTPTEYRRQFRSHPRPEEAPRRG